MNSKKTAGIVIALAGAVMLVFSGYISSQVAEGKEKIKKAQSQVNTGNSIFSVNPISKQVGQMATGSAQKKIDAGSAKAAEYEKTAHLLQMGGIGALIVGAIVFFLGKKKS